VRSARAAADCAFMVENLARELHPFHYVRGNAGRRASSVKKLQKCPSIKGYLHLRDCKPYLKNCRK
jgi:hypothetical protein